MKQKSQDHISAAHLVCVTAAYSNSSGGVVPVMVNVRSRFMTRAVQR